MVISSPARSIELERTTNFKCKMQSFIATIVRTSETRLGETLNKIGNVGVASRIFQTETAIEH